MSASIESRRIKEALQLQFTAIQTYAARLSTLETEELDADLVELERAVADLRDIIESLPHRHRQARAVGAPAASPATTRPEREAKGAATADGTQRLRHKT